MHFDPPLRGEIEISVLVDDERVCLMQRLVSGGWTTPCRGAIDDAVANVSWWDDDESGAVTVRALIDEETVIDEVVSVDVSRDTDPFGCETLTFPDFTISWQPGGGGAGGGGGAFP